MPLSLKFILSIFILLFLVYVVVNVKKEKISIRHAILWIFISIVAIICIFQIENLSIVADWIGVQTTSNLIFFLGFLFLIFVTFSLTKTVTTQEEKIAKLTQEVALLRGKNGKKRKH